MSKKILAIAVVAIVAVSALGVGYIVLNKEETVDDVVQMGSMLEVYGNANNDYKIDADDKTLIQQIIDGEKALKDYPLADANRDGTVDKKDLDLVDEIINATFENRVTVSFINYTLTERYVDTVKFPIDSFAVGANMKTLLLFKCLGIIDEMKAARYSPTSLPDSTIFQEYLDNILIPAKSVGTMQTGIVADKASNFITSDNITAYITSSSGANERLTADEARLKDMGVDTVRLNDSAADGSFLSSVALLGFLFGQKSNDYWEKCENLIDWYSGLSESLHEKLKPVRKGSTKKLKGVASSMSGRVSTIDSVNSKLLEIAGVECPLPENLNPGGSTAQYKSGEHTWLDSYELDTIVIMRTGSSNRNYSWYAGDILVNGKATFVPHFNNFKTTESYEKRTMFIVCADLPAVIESMFIAEHLYPELFEEGYAMRYMGEFTTDFLGMPEGYLEGKSFVYTMDDFGIGVPE